MYFEKNKSWGEARVVGVEIMKVELDNTDMERISYIICSSAVVEDLSSSGVDSSVPVGIPVSGYIALLFPCSLAFEVHTKFIHNSMPAFWFFVFFQNFG